MYRIRYKYLNPSGAGPYSGSMLTKERREKGEIIYAPFGRAEITSCREVKPEKQA